MPSSATDTRERERERVCVPKREREGERVVDIPQFNGPLDRQVSAIKMLTPHVRVIWNTLYSIWNNDGQGGDGGGHEVLRQLCTRQVGTSAVNLPCHNRLLHKSQNMMCSLTKLTQIWIFF